MKKIFIVLSLIVINTTSFAQVKLMKTIDLQWEFLCASMALDGNTITVGTYSEGLLFDAKTGEKLEILCGSDDIYSAVISVAYSPNSTLLAVARERGIVFVKDLTTGKIVFNLVIENLRNTSVMTNYFSLDISKDNRHLVIFYNNIEGLPSYISIYDITTGKLVKKFENTYGTHGRFLQDSRRLILSNSSAGTYSIYDIYDNAMVKASSGKCYYYSGINKIICTDVSISAENTNTHFTVFDESANEQEKEFTAQNENVAIYPTSFSPDGKYALATINRELTLIEFNTWKKIMVFPDSFNAINSFSNDGKLMLTRTKKSLNLWDISDLYSNVKDSSLYK